MPKITHIGTEFDATLPLRVTHRKGGEKKLPSIRVKCGCCSEALEIYYDSSIPVYRDPYTETLEINGVNATISQWIEIFELVYPGFKKYVRVHAGPNELQNSIDSLKIIKVLREKLERDGPLSREEVDALLADFDADLKKMWVEEDS